MHMLQVHLFGEGIYLSRDLGVCLTYSHRGVGWERLVVEVEEVFPPPCAEVCWVAACLPWPWLRSRTTLLR